MKNIEYVREFEGNTLLFVAIVPNSSKNQIVGPYGLPVRLKFKIAAVPEDGKANAALIIYLSEILQVNRSSIEVLRGHTSKQKDIIIKHPYSEICPILSKL